MDKLNSTFKRKNIKGSTLIGKACKRSTLKSDVLKGFTLIEMLVVISIIGILMGVLLTSFQGTKGTARDGRRKTDLESIKASLEIYRTDCNSYPPQGAMNNFLSGTGPLVGQVAACSSNTYMQVAPQDPVPTKYKYIYLLDATGFTFSVCAYIEDGSASVNGCGVLGGGGHTYGDCGVSTPTFCNYKAGQI